MCVVPRRGGNFIVETSNDPHASWWQNKYHAPVLGETKGTGVFNALHSTCCGHFAEQADNLVPARTYIIIISFFRMQRTQIQAPYIYNISIIPSTKSTDTAPRCLLISQGRKWGGSAVWSSQQFYSELRTIKKRGRSCSGFLIL